jgi:hypothetical protein
MSFTAEMFWCSFTSTRSRGYKRDGKGACRRWRAWWWPDWSWVLVSAHYLHPTGTTGNDMDSTTEVWICGGFASDWVLFITQVGVVLHPYWAQILILSVRFDVPSDCSVELSPLGYQFFTDIFEIFDKVTPQFHRLIYTMLNAFLLGPGRSTQNVGTRRGFQHITRKSMGIAKVPRHYIVWRNWSSHLTRLVGPMEVSKLLTFVLPCYW